MDPNKPSAPVPAPAPAAAGGPSPGKAAAAGSSPSNTSNGAPQVSAPATNGKLQNGAAHAAEQNHAPSKAVLAAPAAPAAAAQTAANGHHASSPPMSAPPVPAPGSSVTTAMRGMSSQSPVPAPVPTSHSATGSTYGGLAMRSPAAAPSAMSPSPVLQQIQHQPTVFHSDPSGGAGTSGTGATVGTSAAAAGQAAASAASASAAAVAAKYVPPLSARAREKRPMLNLEQTPRERLEQEVQHEQEGLIPLAEVVTRLANYGYESLQNLGETMSSLSGDERRSRMYNAALEARRQFVKLLVLTMWSRHAPGIAKTRDLIGLVNEQFNQSNDAVQELTEIRKSLPNSRARRYDLETAADVLHTGTYSRAPLSVRGIYEEQKAYTDAEALALVRELDEAIRVRLGCAEALPPALWDYRVTDGRAVLRAADLFEAAVTLSGRDPHDRWYLLNVEFDVAVVGQGAHLFPRHPNKAQRARILAQADAILAPRDALDEQPQQTAEDEPPDPGAAAAAGGEGDTDADVESSAYSSDPKALARLYSFLRACALSYQLEALHYQARQLVAGDWGAHLRIEWSPGRALQLRYWSLLPPAPPPLSQQPAQSARAQPPASRRRQQELLTSGTIAVEVPAEAQGAADDLLQTAPAHLTAKDSAAPSDDAELHINCQAIDLAEVVRTITARQAHLSLLRILQTTLPAHEHQVRTDADRRRVRALISLAAGRSLEVSLSCISGRIELDLAEDGAGEQAAPLGKAHGTFAQLLADGAQRVNADPRRFGDVWRAIRLEVVMQDTEQRICFAGLQSTRKLPFADGELLKLDALRQYAFLFSPIDRWPSYYLITAISADEIRLGLIRADLGPMSQLILQSVEWFDRSKLSSSAQASTAGVSSEEIEQVHYYCIALISYFRVEQQLGHWQVPFARVRSWPRQLDEEHPAAPSGPEKLDALVPCLSLSSRELLGELSDMVKPNVFLRIRDWWDPDAAEVQFAICWKTNLGLSAEPTVSPEGLRVSYDPSTRIMRTSASDIDQCIDAFKLFALRISRVAVLAKAVARVQKRKAIPKLRLKELSLSQISFDYYDSYTATVRWVMLVNGQWRYRLGLLAREGQNPHKVMERQLEAYLNSATTPVHWLRFLRLLRDTLPLLRALQKLQENASRGTGEITVEALSVSQVMVLFRKSRALDIRLISGSRLLLSDGHRYGLNSGQYHALGFHTKAPRVPLPDFAKVVQTAYEQSKSELEPLIQKRDAAKPDGAEAAGDESTAHDRSAQPLVVNLQHGLLCSAEEEVATPVVTALVKELLSHHAM